MTQSSVIPQIGYNDGIAQARSLVVWLIFATSFVVSFEPAPCDVMAILSILFFVLPGVNILPAVTPLLLLYLLFLIGYLTSYFVNGADDRGAMFLATSTYAWWVQPVSATTVFNLSAGVRKPSVFRGRVFKLRAT